MPIAADEQYSQAGESRGSADHDQNLIDELSMRLDSLWRLDQYIANAENKPKIREFWEGVREQEHQNIDRLKELVAEEVNSVCC